MTARTSCPDISRAARGAAAIARSARGEQDAARLAYTALYACGFDGRHNDLERYRAVTRYAPDDGFAVQLRQEIDDTVDVTGWIVTGHDDDRVLLSQNGMQAFVEHDQLESIPPVGESVRLSLPVLRMRLMPGFIVRVGAMPLVDRAMLTRFYINIKPSGASWALGTLAQRLDASALPYEMKILAHPKAYLRRDSCVLYVPSALEDQTIRLLTQAVQQAPGTVGRTEPRLTGAVTPGVGLAHEPSDIGDGLSHGQWVANLFHRAASSTTDPRGIAEHVRAAIAEAGRDPGRPYVRAA